MRPSVSSDMVVRSPYPDLSAGISVLLSHLPFTYRKKSAPGRTVVSRPERSTPQLP